MLDFLLSPVQFTFHSLAKHHASLTIELERGVGVRKWKCGESEVRTRVIYVFGLGLYICVSKINSVSIGVCNSNKI